MIRYVLVAAGALAIGGGIAELHVAAQSYQPIVRVQAPEGVTYTAVLDPTRRPACGAASQRFIAPITAGCPECKIVLVRCQRSAEGLPAFAAEDDPSAGHSQVRMPGVSIRIEAAPDKARRQCEWIADSVQRLGVPGAQCVAKAAKPATT